MEITQGVRFDTLGLSPELMRALEKKGYEVSTPIQAGCIPPMMDWQDVTAKAPTGTGKTFAFGIPIIDTISRGDGNPQALGYVLGTSLDGLDAVDVSSYDVPVYFPTIGMSDDEVSELAGVIRAGL